MGDVDGNGNSREKEKAVIEKRESRTGWEEVTDEQRRWLGEDGISSETHQYYPDGTLRLKLTGTVMRQTNIPVMYWDVSQKDFQQITAEKIKKFIGVWDEAETGKKPSLFIYSDDYTLSLKIMSAIMKSIKWRCYSAYCMSTFNIVDALKAYAVLADDKAPKEYMSEVTMLALYDFGMDEAGTWKEKEVNSALMSLCLERAYAGRSTLFVSSVPIDEFIGMYFKKAKHIFGPSMFHITNGGLSNRLEGGK